MRVATVHQVVTHHIKGSSAVRITNDTALHV
jgi:hypothetical protein